MIFVEEIIVPNLWNTPIDYATRLNETKLALDRNVRNKSHHEVTMNKHSHVEDYADLLDKLEEVHRLSDLLDKLEEVHRLSEKDKALFYYVSQHDSEENVTLTITKFVYDRECWQMYCEQ